MFTEMRFKVSEISLVTGMTPGTITAYASKAGWTTRHGLTITQVVEILARTNKRPRDPYIPDPVKCEDLRHGLKLFGFVFENPKEE